MAVVTLHERTTVEQRRQQLYDRLCQLMERQQPYTDETLNRHKLAAMLATNHRYVEEAIRACSDHPSTSSFINAYRINHAARSSPPTTPSPSSPHSVVSQPAPTFTTTSAPASTRLRRNTANTTHTTHLRLLFILFHLNRTEIPKVFVSLHKNSNR